MNWNPAVLERSLCLSQHMSRPVWSLPETIWMIQRRIGRMSCGQYYSIATQKHHIHCGPWELIQYDLGLLFFKGRLTRIRERTNAAMYEFLGKLVLPLVRALRMKSGWVFEPDNDPECNAKSISRMWSSPANLDLSLDLNVPMMEIKHHI